jgi:hypothetical protein
MELDIFTALTHSLLIEVMREGEKARPDITFSMYAMYPQTMISMDSMNGFEAVDVQQAVSEFLCDYTLHVRLGDYLTPIIMMSKVSYVAIP